MLGEPLETRVFPNFSAVTKYALRGVDSMQSVAAHHLRQRRGEGLDFHQLREYRVGDTFRQIDWKATARSQKLISKEFQEERDQHVIFLIDSGHRMLARDDELSHFDHVLNTVLVLGYIALRQGDAVGYMTCEPDPQWMKDMHPMTCRWDRRERRSARSSISPAVSQAPSNILPV